MKLKMMTAAVSAIITGQAFALAPTASYDLVVRVSGATAVDNQFEAYVNELCDGSTLDSFFQPSDVARGYGCTVRGGSVAGIATDLDVLFEKNSSGSSAGVAPVANKSDVSFLDLTSCTVGSVNGGTYDCTDANVDRPAEIGVSDVEPELFTIAANGARVFDPSNLTVSTVNAQTFGVVVSEGLRNALQTAQGLANNDDVANMPTLSSDVVANIFSGRIASWNDLVGATSQGIATAAGQSNDEVNVCVRTPGSGTQAQFNAFYMKNACSYRGAGNATFVGFDTSVDSDGIQNVYDAPYDLSAIADEELGCGPDGDTLTAADLPFTAEQKACLDDGGISPLAAPWTHWAKGSSDMGKCVTRLSANGYWAIGVQSVEKVKEARTDRNQFKYVAIDGVAPTLENVAAGLYKNWAAASIQWENSVVTGQKLAFAQAFVAKAQSIASVQSFNAGLKGSTAFPQFYNGATAANTGSLAFSGGSLVPTIPFDASNPVMPFNKGLVGPSSCKSQVLADKVDVSIK